MDFDELYIEIIQSLRSSGVDVDPSTGEGEEFFSDLLARFTGTRDEFLAYVSTNAKDWFRVLTVWPDWIQGPEWQYINRKPMVFVGQLDVSASSGWFHDDVNFYLFYDPETGGTATVSQIA